MAFQLKQPIFPCLFTILLFLSTTSYPHAKAKPCNCTGSDQNRRSKSNRTYTMDDPGLQFYLIDEDSNSVRAVGLNSVRNLSNTELKITGGLSTIDQGIPLWEHWFDRDIAEASFSVTIVYQPLWSPLWNEESRNQSSTPELYRSRLTFLILPETDLMFLEQRDSANTLAKQLVASFGLLELYNDTTRTDIVAGTLVAVRIGALTKLAPQTRFHGNIMGVDVTMDTPSMELTFNYSVWIDYDRVGSRLSVYVGIKGKSKPVNAIAEVRLSISDFTDQFVRFGLLSTMAQLLASGGIDLSAKVEGLPDDYSYYRGMSSKLTITILSCVIGSIAIIAVLATAVAWYFTSRYRRWHTDLDQLAMSMQRLPGVPTKVEFADIKKATSNFHEAMKLGGGGFGTVYRCTLPAAASKTERPMDVAVKRFTRDVQNRCYDDFLAEVSIINRLRHKNIVPLVGWSYNKGEPLLVFEFMPNGSLDQHLFPKDGSGSGNGTGIQWAIRYEIIRDIAIGLHYVHHEYEPMVLHCDIKASNVMLDSSFRGRLGDFGLACIVAVNRNSATGIGGTRGYMALEYALSGKATRQTDIFALGVLILEVVTGQRALFHRASHDDDIHITDRVWRLHREGRLTDCVDPVVVAAFSQDDEQLALDVCDDLRRLLLLGLACCNPNPLDRPNMPEVVRVIAKSAPPPEVPLMKPRFVWPPPEGEDSDDDDSAGPSRMTNLDGSAASTSELQWQSQISLERTTAQASGAHASFRLEHSVYVSAPGGLCLRDGSERDVVD